MRTAALTILALAALGAAPARQEDRRSRDLPELVPSVAGRTGTCDELRFASDGKYLLAGGDDKVVHRWPVADAGLDLSGHQQYRWPAWRERRGGVKSFALPADPADARMAVAGFGLRTSAVCLIDRATGEVSALSAPSGQLANVGVVLKVAFAPDGRTVLYGTESGHVVRWDLGDGHSAVGRHEPALPATVNPIRLLAFAADGTLLSVAGDGTAKRWNLDLPGTPVWEYDENARVASGVPYPVYRAALAPDGRTLALAHAAPRLALVDLTQNPPSSFHLNLRPGEACRSVAFAPSSDALVLGVVRRVDPKGGPRFALEGDDRVVRVSRTADGWEAGDGPAHTGRAEALAWHGDRLAVAGGPHHEVRLYDASKFDKPLTTVRGAGRCVYGVRLSKQGTLALRTEADATASHPNRTGAGRWHAFDLRTRPGFVPLAKGDFLPEPADALEGWTLEPPTPGGKRWVVVAPNGGRSELPVDPATEQSPRCYAFVPGSASETSVKILVGHYYGVTLFQASPGTLARRLMSGFGHADQVLSVCVSDDGTWAVSGGRDQTVAAWDLRPGASGNALGATVAGTAVGTVDLGGPAWEAGLRAGDAVAGLKVGQTAFFDAAVPGSATPQAVEAALAGAVPGGSLELTLRRAGRDEPVVTVTSVRRRPLWKLFPTFASDRPAEWVLWTGLGSFYRSSTNGDATVGWHVNHPTLDGTPTFYPASRFARLYAADGNALVTAALRELVVNRNPEPALKLAAGKGRPLTPFAEREPAPVRLTATSDRVDARGVTVRVSVAARGTNPDLLPDRVELWVNDFRFKVLPADGRPVAADVPIPPDVFRSGTNVVTAVSLNALGGRGEARLSLARATPAPTPNLFGLGVGFDDYGRSVGANGTREFGNLEAARGDAARMALGWTRQRGRFYDAVAFPTLAPDADPEAILKALAELGKRVRPDDRLVLFLAGHGTTEQGMFVFCCPSFDRTRHTQTGVTAARLEEALAAINCRKLVLLDACHSGAVTSNPLRDLTVGTGLGPTIFAACDSSQQAFEDRARKTGLFTRAVLEALGDGDAPTLDGGPVAVDGLDGSAADGAVDSRELLEYVRRRVPELARAAAGPDATQDPVSFPAEPERLPLAK